MTKQHEAVDDYRGWIDGGDLRLAYQVEGQRQGPTLVLVHGYPDSRRIWDPLVAALKDRYRIIRYDVRGAGESEAPGRLSGYRMEWLEQDLACVVDALSPATPVHLVAHDWGGIQTWEAVTGDRLVGRLASFTVVSGPCLDHVGHWMRDCRRSGRYRPILRQLKKSWYIYLFHLPFIAPLMWRFWLGRYWPGIVALWENERPRPDPHQARQGRLGINLYRANMLPRILKPRERYAHVPVYVIQPEDDQFVSPQLSEELDRWVPRLKRDCVPGHHWQVLAHPADLAERVDQFIGQVETDSLEDQRGSSVAHPV